MKNKQRLRIAMIGQKGIPVQFGGVERHVEELSIELLRRGFAVDVYTRKYYTPKSKRSYRGVRLICVPSIRTKHFDAISHSFFATVHALVHRADVIHYHGVGPSLLSWIPRVFSPRTRVVVTFHCIDRYHEKWGLLARALLALGEWTATHFPHTTIAVSRTIQDYCQKKFSRPTLYIPNGITPQTKTAHKQTLRRKFGLETGRYLLSVTRLVPHKDVHTLIEAYRRIKTDLPLVIVGGGANTDKYVARLHELAKGDPRIRFTGYVRGNQVEELYANSFAFIHPSRAEGLPIVLLEAMRAGRPILASRIPEHLELLIPETQTPLGSLFRAGDARDLEQKLLWLIKYPARVNDMATQARQYVLKNFRWSKIAVKTAELYRELHVAKRFKSPRLRDYHISPRPVVKTFLTGERTYGSVEPSLVDLYNN